MVECILQIFFGHASQKITVQSVSVGFVYFDRMDEKFCF